MRTRALTLLLLSVILLSLGACAQLAAPVLAPTVAPAATAVPPTPVPPTAVPTAAPTVAPAPAEAAILEISNGDVTKSLTLSELKQLPAVEGWAGIKSSTGKITPPSQFKGVSLATLAGLVDGLKPEMGINVVAKDGYAMTFSYDQVTKSTYTAFDPATGDEIKDAGELTTAVVYERDGAPIPEESDGTLRLAILSPKMNQVTDGHWSVKWVRKVVMKPLAAEWSLSLKGNIEDEVDRASFESCAAPKCHGVTWKDDKAQTWAGVPLWLLVGRMDDENKHEKGFNAELAEKGYDVSVIAADGYEVTLPSSRVTRNSNILLALTVNDNPLQDKDFPLRLVGADVGKKEQVGGVTKMTMSAAHAVSSPAAATVAPTAAPTAAPVATTAAPAGDVALTISGAVEKPLSLTLDALKKLGLEKITAEHPKKGKTDYEGVRLSVLLEQCQPKSGASKLILTASDGYKVEAPLAAVRACADCMVAVAADGTLSTAMPGMESSAWAKNLVSIDVQ